MKFTSAELAVEFQIQDTVTSSVIEQVVLSGSETFMFDIVPTDDNTPYPDREVIIELQVNQENQ